MNDEDDNQNNQPKTDSAVDQKSIKRRLKKADREKDESAQFWRRILADPIGRREIWRLLNDAHTFETRFACGPNGFPQPEATWFHAGEQDFGLRLYRSLMKIDIDGLRLMHLEYDSAFLTRKTDG